MSEYTLSDGKGTVKRTSTGPNQAFVDYNPANLSAASDINGADVVGVQRGSADPVKASADQIANFSRWRTIATSRYSATPATTSTISMSDTSGIVVGMPIRYTYSGTTYYGIVTSVTANTSIAIAGATLNTGTALTSLELGQPELVVQLDFFISGTYATSIQDVLAAKMNAYANWQLSDAFLVAFQAVQKTVDTTTQPKVNVKINGNLVSTNDSNNGVQLSTSGTWVTNSAIAINTTNYAVVRGNPLEVRVTAAGGTADAAHLTVSCVLVLK